MNNLEIIGLVFAAALLLALILAPIAFLFMASIKSYEIKNFYQGLTGLGKTLIITSIVSLTVGYLWSAVSLSLNVLAAIQ